MNAIDADVHRTVEFGLERYWINRVPWALLGCAAGLFMIAMDPGPPGFLPLVLIGVLLIIGAAYAISVVALDHVIERLKPVWGIGLVLALVVGLLLFVGTPSRHHRSSLDPSFRVLGWIFVIFSLGFIGFALKKYLRPSPPLLRLSPAGLHLNISWLKGLVIPWYEVEHVGQLEHHHPGGIVMRHPETLAIAFSQAYYEREILPRRSFLSGRTWTAIFQERRAAQMQMLLPYPWFSIAMKEMQAPVEARWKAFRELDAGASPPPAAGAPVRATAWSPARLTRWRIAWLALPMSGILLMLAHFAGAWDSAFLKTAREDFTRLRADNEAARRESQRLHEQYRRAIEDGEKRQREYEERRRQFR